jgi:hypothetical protein
MEWNRSGAQPQTHPAGHGGSHKRKKLGSLNLRIASVTLLFCVTILIVALVGLVTLGGPKPENNFVQGDKLQAVFLNGGQVYFGNIKNLNDKYMRMSNIYYLRVNQTVQPKQASSSTAAAAQNDISLVKLGCELHGPTDEMLINRDMIIFWENLKGDGQVAKAVDEYKKQNPGGQNCTTTNNSTNSNTNSGATQNSTAP